jgi:hypothetical protein
MLKKKLMTNIQSLMHNPDNHDIVHNLKGHVKEICSDSESGDSERISQRSEQKEVPKDQEKLEKTDTNTNQ